MGKVPVVDPPARRVLEFLPLFERPDFSHGTWHHEQGHFGYFEYSPDVLRFEQVLNEDGWVQPFDWSSWKDKAEELVRDPLAAGKLDRPTIQKLLTLHVRADRFNEGHLAAMFENGHIVAILRRLAELDTPDYRP